MTPTEYNNLQSVIDGISSETVLGSITPARLGALLKSIGLYLQTGDVANSTAISNESAARQNADNGLAKQINDALNYVNDNFLEIQNLISTTKTNLEKGDITGFTASAIPTRFTLTIKTGNETLSVGIPFANENNSGAMSPGMYQSLAKLSSNAMLCYDITDALEAFPDNDYTIDEDTYMENTASSLVCYYKPLACFLLLKSSKIAYKKWAGMADVSRVDSNGFARPHTGAFYRAAFDNTLYFAPGDNKLAKINMKEV